MFVQLVWAIAGSPAIEEQSNGLHHCCKQQR
jgi:hypothetical protein